MEAEELLKGYERFRVLSEEMLESIESDDWDRIVSISERREKVLEELMERDDTLLTDHSERMCRSDLIHQCLEMNKKMQSLIEAKMGELQQNYVNEKKMLQTYHLHSGE